MRKIEKIERKHRGNLVCSIADLSGDGNSSGYQVWGDIHKKYSRFYRDCVAVADEYDGNESHSPYVVCEKQDGYWYKKCDFPDWSIIARWSIAAVWPNNQTGNRIW